MDEEKVLCGAGGRAQKFYWNPRYQQLPETVKQELKAALAATAERVGGSFLLGFNEQGDVLIHLIPDEGDIYFDEIEAGLEISRLQKEKEELFQQLKLYYIAFFGEKE